MAMYEPAMNNMTATGAQQHAPQVYSALDDLDKNVEELNLVLAELHARLGPVLRIELKATESDNKAGVPVPALVPLAQRVAEATAKIASLHFGLRDMLRRLEI